MSNIDKFQNLKRMGLTILIIVILSDNWAIKPEPRLGCQFSNSCIHISTILCFIFCQLIIILCKISWRKGTCSFSVKYSSYPSQRVIHVLGSNDLGKCTKHRYVVQFIHINPFTRISLLELEKCHSLMHVHLHFNISVRW